MLHNPLKEHYIYCLHVMNHKQTETPWGSMRHKTQKTKDMALLQIARGLTGIKRKTPVFNWMSHNKSCPFLFSIISSSKIKGFKDKYMEGYIENYNLWEKLLPC